MPGAFTLYSWPESGNSYKVRLLNALLNIDYDIKDLDFLNLEQQSDWFKKLNPKAEVPTLQQGDLILTDSSSILTYIAGTFPDPGKTQTPSSFWSTELLEQAKIIEWLAFANGWVQHGVFTARAILSYGGPYNGLGQNTDDNVLLRQRLSDSKIRAHKSLEIINGHLRDSPNTWLVGGRPTIADISNFVYIALAPMGDVSLQNYKSVLKWIQNIKALPGFIDIPGLEDPLVRRRGTKFEADTNK